jgi:transcriptional regulator with XRE-family HTH domain
MLQKILDSIYDESPNIPNKYTSALGNRIRKARLEAKMSQTELAEKAYLRQSSISKIEAGTRSVLSEEILYLSYALDKPINYFFPKEFTHELSENELTQLEKELLMQARKLSRDDLRKLIAQARAIAEF